MKHLLRALAVLLLAAAALPATSYASPSPAQVNLRPSDLPAYNVVMQTLTILPPDERKIFAGPGILAMMTSSENFLPKVRRRLSAGAIASTVDLYRSAHEAAAAYQRMRSRGLMPSQRVLPHGCHVGVQCVVYVYNCAYDCGFELDFWRGRYGVDIDASAPVGVNVLPELAHLARVIDGRIETHG